MRKLSAYDLKRFYKSLKGRIVRKLIREKILSLWPEIPDRNCVGYGYALPYLRPYLEGDTQIYNMMPAQLGVHDWPPEAQNLVCLTAEQWIPLETNSVDRILMVHALEFLEYPEEAFEELWRVLKSTGRILIVVPNRLGFWARADWNPFGQGRPYTARQVENFLSENLFVHESTSHALFSPPFQNSFLLRAAHMFEKIGPYLYPGLGGVTVIEASKQLYAGKGKRAYSKSRHGAKATVTAKPMASPRDNLKSS